MNDSDSIKQKISEAQEKIGELYKQMELETDERKKESLYESVKEEVANTKYLGVQLGEAQDRESKQTAQQAVTNEPPQAVLDSSSEGRASMAKEMGETIRNAEEHQKELALQENEISQENTGADTQESTSYADESKASTAPVLTRKLIRQNLPTIRPALRLTAASVLAQLSEFRERVRSDNHLRVEHEQFHDELLETLDQIAPDIEDLLSAMSNADGPATEEEVEAAASWLESFQSRIETKIVACSDPNKAADIAWPVGVTLGFGAIGAIIGSIAGPAFAAGGLAFGGFLARVALGEVKSSEITSKIEEGLVSNKLSTGEQQSDD